MGYKREEWREYFSGELGLARSVQIPVETMIDESRIVRLKRKRGQDPIIATIMTLVRTFREALQRMLNRMLKIILPGVGFMCIEGRTETYQTVYQAL